MQPLVIPATSFALLWGIELTLARVTSQQQQWADMLVSAIALIGLPTLLLAVGLRTGVRRTLLGLLAATPLVAVAGGIVLPPAWQYAGGSAAGLLALGLLGVWVAVARHEPGEESFAPSLGATLAVSMASSATAWVLLPSGFPPFQVNVPLLLGAVLLARLASRPNGLPLVAIGAVALALWPPVLPPFPWAAPPAASGQADLLVISVDAPTGGVERLEAFGRLARDGSGFRLRHEGDDGVGAVRAVLTGGSDGDDSGGSLAQQLAASGYDTAAVVAAEPRFAPESGLYRGFAVFHHVIDRNRFALPRAWALTGGGGERRADYGARPLAADALIALGVRTPPRFAPAEEVFGVAAKVMSERRSQPIFLWVHFRDSADAVAEQLARILDTLGSARGGEHVVAIVAVGSQEPGLAVALGGSAWTREDAGGAAVPRDAAELGEFLRRVATAGAKDS